MLLSLRAAYTAHPEYEMGNRLMLDRLDELQDVGVDRKRFPTVDDETTLRTK